MGIMIMIKFSCDQKYLPKDVSKEPTVIHPKEGILLI